MPGPSKTVIKINALGRLLKEYDLYKAEEMTYTADLVKVENAIPRDEYEIKRSTQILNETLKVKEQVWQQIQNHANEVRKLTNLKPEEEANANHNLALVAKLVR